MSLNKYTATACHKISLTLMIAFFFCGFNFAAFAQNAKSYFEDGNHYYKSKQYEEAVKMYELVLKNDKHNVNALYNLGNAYYHLQRFPDAILYYEKARKIEPDNKYILQNITLTNNKLFTKMEFSKEFFVTQKIKNVANSKSSDTWSIYMLVLFWLGVITVCLHFFFNKPTLFKIGIFSILCSLLFAFFTYRSFEKEQIQEYAIVMQTDAQLKSKPVDDNAIATMLQAGTKVQIVDSDKNWYKVKLPNDKTGWIKNNAIELI